MRNFMEQVAGGAILILTAAAIKIIAKFIIGG